jgi:DNA polymerase III subunit epsilon
LWPGPLGGRADAQSRDPLFAHAAFMKEPLGWLKFRQQSNPNSLFPQETPLHSLRYAVLDTELTSLDSRSNRLLSVGAITMEGTRIRLGEQFYRVVNPGVTVPPQGVLIHKLRPNDVEKGESPESALVDLQQFIAGKVLVGHFVNVDLKALRKELGDSAHRLSNPAIDTARVHGWILRHEPYREDLEQQLGNISLAALAGVYHLDFQEAHHALDDAFVTARLWQKMICKLEGMKVRNLGDVLRIGKA